MKKLLSLALVLCMCCSLPLALTGCGDSGEKTAYQEFVKSVKKSTNDINAHLEKKNGECNPQQISNGYSLNGYLKMYANSKSEDFTVFMNASVHKPNENDKPAYYYGMTCTMIYDAATNTMSAYITAYNYYTMAVENGNTVSWKDGYGFQSESGTVLELSFDMSKYFENGGLTVEDATVVTDIEMNAVRRNEKGLGSDGTYTERHPEWRTDTRTQFLYIINERLKLVDAYIAGR